MTQKKVTRIPNGANGQFITGYQLLDKSYIVGDTQSSGDLAIGSFACKGNDGECVGQKGDGAVIGFIPFQEFKSDVKTDNPSIFKQGQNVHIEIGNMAIYALEVGDTVDIKKDDYIGIKKDDGSLVFNADKTTATTGDNKDTGFKVFQSNGTQKPGIIYIKKI